MKNDHICARHAICFQCFKAGVDRTRARREAWAQRSLPFESAPPELTRREMDKQSQLWIEELRRKAYIDNKL